MADDREAANTSPDVARSVYCSVNDAIRMTGLGRTTIYKLMNEGAISSFTVGRRRLIQTGDLRRLHVRPNS